MKYVLAVAIIAVLGVGLGVLYNPDIAAWDPPEDCADEDRVNTSNRLSPCRGVMPEISHVEHRVRMEYPDCIEEMVFHMPGSEAPDFELDLKVQYYRHAHSAPSLDWWRFDKVYDGHAVFVVGNRWRLNSSVGETSGFGNPTPDTNKIRLSAPNSSIPASPFVERPRTDAFTELVYACLALLQQEQEDREHAAAVQQAETEAAAHIEAQRDADEKAELQAQRDAESQARIAAQELAAAQESKRRVAATELLKTQTLSTQIEHEEVIAGILRDIVRIRLAGQEDRARITNEYLTRSEAAATAFEGETAETETRIQAFLDFNTALLARLEEYQADIGARLERVRTSIAEQQAEIDRLAQEAQEEEGDTDAGDATPEPEPPTPEPTDEP